MKTRRKTGEFATTTDDGSVVMIEEFTDFIDAGSMGNPNAEIEGLKTLLTADGNHVNVVAQGEYEIVETGVRVRKR